MQKQPPDVSYKKTVLKNFAIFTRKHGKHLRRSLLLIQNIGKFLRAPILKNICEQLFWKNFKMLIRDFNSSLKKQDFSTSISEISENVCLFSFIPVILWSVSLGVCIYKQHFFDVVRNKLPELIKRKSKV